MREIKFRAFDLVNKSWVYVILEKGSNFNVSFSEGRNLTEWYQYAGLKDKKGNEIYEGDVLYWNNRFPQIELVEVGSFGGSWCECGGGIGFNVNEDYTKDCIVKGNIHETPELVPK